MPTPNVAAKTAEKSVTNFTFHTVEAVEGWAFVDYLASSVFHKLYGVGYESIEDGKVEFA